MDRGMKKWKPFNSVVPNKELLRKENDINFPTFSRDDINIMEELIKDSLYNSVYLEISYIKDNNIFSITSVVKKVDLISKNIFFYNGDKINFRQIIRIKKIR